MFDISLLKLLYISAVFSPRVRSLTTFGVTSDPTSANKQLFDYIIVGGGLTGLTVASRLTENSNTTVLVIEAGNDDRTDPRVTDVHQYGAAFGTSLTWSYEADQGKTIFGGRTLGGGSSINGAAWTRGIVAQYDGLADLLENDEASLNWNWNSLFSYMKKAEGFTPPNTAAQAKGASWVPDFHGLNGPVKAGFTSTMYGGPQQPAFVSSISNLTGIVHEPDFNGGNTNAVAYDPNSIDANDNDVRSTAATAYLSPVEHTRTNWLTLINHQVTKITFSGTQATGVTFKNSNNTGAVFTATANKEVLVAAGTIATPALLQLSGVGNRTFLQSLGINVVMDLPTVGKNFQEQTMISLGAVKNYTDDGGRGPSDCIAYPNLAQIFGVNSPNISQQILTSIHSWATSQAQYALSASALEQILQKQSSFIVNDSAPVAEFFFDTGFPVSNGVGIDMWTLLPFSRGRVQIKSSDPFTKPDVLVNYFNIDFDMAMQIGAARIARKTFQASPLSGLLKGETIPGFSAVPDDPTGGSEAAWRSWIKNNFSTVHHPIGTAAMMKKTLGGVVDGRLRVYGTTGLRVIDASILPYQIGGHMQSTLYGFAEKIADIIQNDV